MTSLGLAPSALVTGKQVHGTETVVVEKPWPEDQAPRADALVTRVPGMALGILTADCAPVLLADSEARVIGAAHAGWRGALEGVIESAVAAMEDLGASAPRIRAAIGPCIARISYEVGPEFPAPFLAQDPANAAFFAPGARAGHFLFDLPGYTEKRLKALGLEAHRAFGRRHRQPRRRGSSPIAAPASRASRATASGCRRSRSRLEAARHDLQRRAPDMMRAASDALASEFTCIASCSLLALAACQGDGAILAREPRAMW